MFERLGAFLRRLSSQDHEADMRADDDPQIAAAALMFHVMDADGIRSAEESRKLEEILRRHFSVDDAELKRLLSAGEEADREAVDFYAFTSVLKRHLDIEARVEFVRIMWEMVYADGARHEIEDHLVWRIAELLDVERPDRLAMRRSVEAQEKGDD